MIKEIFTKRIHTCTVYKHKAHLAMCYKTYAFIKIKKKIQRNFSA
jgi:hypothetical protein